MQIQRKIYSTKEEIQALVNQVRKRKKKIAFCQGHFNVIHPGHLRFIEFAKKSADFLIVAVQGDSKIESVVKDRFYDLQERSRGVASIGFVDAVIIFEDLSIGQLLETIKPDVYIMGEEFSKRIDKIRDQILVTEQNGGKIIFNSGEIKYDSAELLDKDYIDIKLERVHAFKQALKKQDLSLRRILALCDDFEKQNVLVIGDTIVDQYVACEAVGMSSEAPVLVVNELESREFVGGAAIASRHVKALGANCTFVSILGRDDKANLVKDELNREDIAHHFIQDESRPTTFKIRYMVGNQKLLRVSRLKDKHLSIEMEEEVVQFIRGIAPDLDGIIISDFGYGMITPALLENISQIAKEHDIKLFGDVQSSSQIGNVLKFRNYYCLSPTEKEARIALDDKYSGIELIGNNLLRKSLSKNILITMGADGFITFESTENEYFLKTQYFPALNPNPIDVVGAGDSLLTALAVSSCSGASTMEASVFGAIAASIAVGKLGNIPISINEVKACIKEMM